MDKIIQFRPHHFLCTLAYRGMGYSKRFVTNYDQIAALVRNNEDTKIKVVLGLDTICSHCPHQQKDNSCTDQIVVDKLDQSHAQILEIQNGDVLSFREAKQKLRTNMTLDRFHSACAPCEWKSLGVCETALKTLHACSHTT